MKNTFSWLGILGFLVFAAAGCGSDTPPGNPAGYQNRDQGGGGLAGGGAAGNQCSDQLATDAGEIQQLAQTVGGNPTLDGVKQLRAKLQAFKDKYNGVVCTGANGKTFDVNAAITPQIAKLDQIIHNAGGITVGQPEALESGDVVTDETSVFEDCASAFADFN